MALPDLSRLAALGSPPLTSDTLAGVVGSNQQNGRWSLSQIAGVIGTGGFSPIVSVKDYGATGLGVADDRASIQNAIDAAFGPASSPHGSSNPYLNKPLYFPAGNYSISSPLYLTNVVGARIFGAGSLSTRIVYNGSLSGNTVGPSTGGGLGNASAITPIFMTNGFAYSTLEGMSLSINGANTAAIYLFQDGSAGQTNADTFYDLVIDHATYGILVGYQSSGLCSECNYINVTYSICGSGLRVTGFNALAHNVYGGGANSCTVGGYYDEAGQIAALVGVSMAGNAQDIIIVSSPCSIVGGRSESANCLQVAGGFSLVDVSGFIFEPGPPTAPPYTFLNAGGGGATILRSCQFAPGAGTSVIARLDGNGLVTMDSCVTVPTTAGTITGSSGSKLIIRNCVFANPSTLSSYTGTIGEYSTGNVNPTLTTVATLPTASAAFKGVRMFVTDTTLAVGASFGTTVIGTGGGSNTAPVWCTGADWLKG